VKKPIAVLLQVSDAVTMTGVTVFSGKQVVGGGLNARLGDVGQQGSEAVTLYGTVTQLLQV
jgi:hypothetical protein